MLEEPGGLPLGGKLTSSRFGYVHMQDVLLHFAAYLNRAPSGGQPLERDGDGEVTHFDLATGFVSLWAALVSTLHPEKAAKSGHGSPGLSSQWCFTACARA